ncbi:hypothetical protein SRHO_G00102000 [Serrasalmus rhombeus]
MDGRRDESPFWKRKHLLDELPVFSDIPNKGESGGSSQCNPPSASSGRGFRQSRGGREKQEMLVVYGATSPYWLLLELRRKIINKSINL